jgi:2-oxoglutarate dehydrogenase E2 component (dihydrolipoamide succinyltransferase)
LSVSELENGTFSINNAEVDSSLMTTPIIRPLQSALLGINSVVTKPVAKGGQVVARPTMFISLTYDHRILDGKDAVVTLKSIK